MLSSKILNKIATIQHIYMFYKSFKCYLCLNIPSYERGVARVLGYDLPP